MSHEEFIKKDKLIAFEHYVVSKNLPNIIKGKELSCTKINHGKDDDIRRGHIDYYNPLYIPTIEIFSTQMCQNN
ncbi:hypothetical protein KIN20_016995 [Parelaphostrongylus tenuis]|uniref:Uncharacterized protein n=1 Tax=Parelaphostrongylus tenuis TaxID=148309 RepID=A0AAD5MHA9_PARTN|nr:hypothetical protein KIN20_016995 [Parelaphostrongylus tenuis]